MTAPILVVCENADELANRAADFIVESARQSIAERGCFSLALSGGSTPEKTYTLLAEPAHSAAIDWAKVFVFFADERFVAGDDPRSNFGLAQRTLLARVPLPSAQVFAIPVYGESAAQCAAQYAEILARWFATPGESVPPRLDLILLGLGEDGHAASLFPGAAALAVGDAWVTWSPPGRLPPPVDRITLTYPVLNAARRVAFLVAGANKAATLQEVVEQHASREQRPAAGVQPADGTLTWFVDRDAVQSLRLRR
jgi:6-phosphogluconolactonase